MAATDLQKRKRKHHQPPQPQPPPPQPPPLWGQPLRGSAVLLRVRRATPRPAAAAAASSSCSCCLGGVAVVLLRFVLAVAAVRAARLQQASSFVVVATSVGGRDHRPRGAALTVVTIAAFHSRPPPRPLPGRGRRQHHDDGSCSRRGQASWTTRTARHLAMMDDGSRKGEGEPQEGEESADLWRQRAEALRQQIQQMERQLDRDRATRRTSSSSSSFYNDNNKNEDMKAYEWMERRSSSQGAAGTRDASRSSSGEVEEEAKGVGFSLKNKRVLVAGANGRLGSMVCRHLLRNHPSTQVVAAVHTIGETSSTSRGYGRLGYEVGAEDGIGTIGAAWSEQQQRTATFQFDPATMRDSNLHNLRVVECELLDPVQCQSVVEECDAVLYCATDFNQNVPRAVSALNVALLFRAVTRPDKGRVDVEGVQNMLGAIKQELQERRRRGGRNDDASPQIPSSIVNFVLVSTSPDAYEDYETPFGSFRGIKQQGEELVRQFPSLSTTVLQMARYEDNFVGEDLEIQTEEVPLKAGANELLSADAAAKKSRRKINRRDAAKAAVEALQNENWVGKTMHLWTAT